MPAAQTTSRSAQGSRFEERVGRMLELLGYTVEREQLLDGNRVDLIARKTADFEEFCYLVECKDHRQPKGKDVLEKLQIWTQGKEARERGCRGMSVANKFTPAALTFAKSQRMVAVTLRELENRILPFSDHLSGLRQTFEQSRLARTYVEQNVSLEANPQPKGVDLLTYAGRWARGEVGNPLWLLLGDYGTGKTAFFKKLSYELALRAEQDPSQPIPLAIDLKLSANAVTLETLIQEYLRVQHKWSGDPDIFLSLLEQGRLVLLLDAFDEMGAAAIGRSVEDQFRQLARAATRGAGRVLITCRTHFFRDQQHIKQQFLHSGDSLHSQDSPLGQVARGFQAALDELLMFTPEQIDLFLTRSLGDDPQRVAKAREFIEKTYNLYNLAPRAVMLEMILDSLDNLVKSARPPGEITPALLYQSYASEWLQGRSSKQFQTNEEQRWKLQEHLAHILWDEPQNRIHHRALAERLAALQAEEFPGLDLVRVDQELRTATFLTRTNEGYYSYSHKSFQEFFYARFLHRALRTENEAAWVHALDTAPITRETMEFFHDMLWGKDRELLKPLFHAILGQVYRPRVSENGLRLAWWLAIFPGLKENFGQARYDQFQEAISSWIPHGAKLAGAQLAGEELFFVWLPGADLEGANLGRTDLMGANLEGANLKGANLVEASLAGTKLKGAKLKGANLVEACLTGARLLHSQEPYARAAGANLERVTWFDDPESSPEPGKANKSQRTSGKQNG
ncbi:MAG: pentapeptide repeat-containing protein [Magnetococcus sp. YQC-3]